MMRGPQQKVNFPIADIRESGRFVNAPASVENNRAHAVASILSLVLLLR